MKIIVHLALCSIIISSNIFAVRYEMGLKVLNNDGDPIIKTVFLYKAVGKYPYELYRNGQTTSVNHEGVNGGCDVFYCDVTNQDFPWPTWTPPIWTDSYVLRIDNKYCYFTLITPDCNNPPSGPIDFVIKYQNGDFVLEPTESWMINDISDTYTGWDMVTVTFNQKKSDGATNVGTVSIGEGSFFSPRTAAPFAPYLNKNQTYLFDADPNIYDSEKYHHYQNITDVRNFREQFIGTQNYGTTSIFNHTYPGIIIQNVLSEVQSINPPDDTIQFKDPWLIDYNDPNHFGKKRNRGTYGAIFQPLPSPFYPNHSTYYNGNIYKGIFLNQDYNDPDQPYYSIKEISPQPVTVQGVIRNCYFQSWTYDPDKISLQYPDLKETPVVFKTSDATLTANLKATQLSNNEEAYSNNSQRKFIRTPNGRMYIIYESMGYIWLERSTDNGTTWELMHYGKPIGNTLGKSPSMDYDPSGNLIVISYQEYYYSDYKCRYVVYHALGNSYRYGDVEFETNPELISGDAQMVVA